MALSKQIKNRLDDYIKHYTMIPIDIVRVYKVGYYLQITIGNMYGNRPAVFIITTVLGGLKKAKERLKEMQEYIDENTGA